MPLPSVLFIQKPHENENEETTYATLLKQFLSEFSYI